MCTPKAQRLENCRTRPLKPPPSFIQICRSISSPFPSLATHSTRTVLSPAPLSCVVPCLSYSVSISPFIFRLSSSPHFSLPSPSHLSYSDCRLPLTFLIMADCFLKYFEQRFRLTFSVILRRCRWRAHRKYNNKADEDGVAQRNTTSISC